MKKELIDLIRNGELKDALQEGEKFLSIMRDHYYAWTMLQGRYNDKKAENTKGILNGEKFSNEMNRINSDMLDMVLKIDHDIQSNFITNEKQEKSLIELLQEQLLSTYEILDVLSEGESTVTFKVKERYDDEYAALRVLKSNNYYNDTDAFDEVHKVKKINHRNIISVYGKSAIDANPKYVIMEYIDGINLEQLILQHGPRPVRETKRILSRICDALYYLHKRKIFNADLRASRILIDKEGEPVMSPFIVFRTKSANNYGQIIANLKYMSFQRLNSKDYKHYTPQSNQFSLGVLAYLLLVGEPLFKSDSIIDLINDRTAFESDEEFREEKLAKIEAPEDMIGFVRKLVSKKREERYGSMFEVLAALKNVEDYSNEHQMEAQESYSRACSLNPKIAKDLIEKIDDEDLANFPEIEMESFAMKIHNTINLVIETNANKSYLMKIMDSEELSVLFFQKSEQFKSLLFELLEEFDYLWNEKVKNSWEITLDETFQQFSAEGSNG